MKPDECWELTPGEIKRYSAAVLEGIEDQRWETGTLLSVAFNNPKEIARMWRERQEQKEAPVRAAVRARMGELESLLDTFAKAGAEIRKAST